MISEIFFLLFIFLKQFYIFPSGSLGLGDICLIISFLTTLVSTVKRERSCLLDRGDRIFWYFVFVAAVVNGVYCLKTGRVEFLKYSLYWVYSGIFLWLLRRLVDTRRNILYHSSCIMKINIMIQVIVWLTGRGRIFYEYNGTRYMGTFNDPNQLAFFMFSMVLLLYLNHCLKRDWSYVFFYVMSSIVIMATKSTGIFLGMIVFTIGISILFLKYIYDLKRISWYLIAVICGALLCMSVWSVWMIWPAPDFEIQPGDFTLITRIQEKLYKLFQGGWKQFLIDRGIDKIFFYPQYLLYGAGEGGFDRFSDGWYVNEIHNSVLSIYYCYGIIPATALVSWTGKQIRKTELQMLPAIIALLVECLFLINYRQPFFWWILVYGSIVLNIENGERRHGD